MSWPGHTLHRLPGRRCETARAGRGKSGRPITWWPSPRQGIPRPAVGGSAGSSGPETSGGSRHAVDGPGSRPCTVECPAAQSLEFPRLITTVHKVPAGLWLSQVEHRTLNPAVGGSNPPRPAYLVVLAKTLRRLSHLQCLHHRAGCIRQRCSPAKPSVAFLLQNGANFP